jgi:hypothetical protein
MFGSDGSAVTENASALGIGQFGHFGQFCFNASMAMYLVMAVR